MVYLRRCKDNIERGLLEVGCGVWSGSSWLRIGTVGGNLLMRERGHLVFQVDGRILRWILRKGDVEVWSGSSWLRIGKGGGHLWKC